MTGSRESLSFKSQKRYVLIAALTLFLAVGLSIVFLTRKAPSAPQELAAANLDKALERQRTPWYSSVDKEYVYLPIPRYEKEREEEPVAPREELKNPFWEKLFTVVLPACFFTIVFGILLWILIRKAREKSLSNRLRLEEFARRQRRLETLADEAKSRYDDLKGAALEAYNAEDLRGAIIFYFSWILVEADKRELIWLDKGKTNLEYWRELDRNPEVQRIYRVIMDEFELVYYGGRPISRRAFEELWENRTLFEELMAAEDERIVKRRQEAETMKIRNNAKNWGAPKFHLLLAAIVCSTLPLAGCKEKTWRTPYGNDTNQAPQDGLNSLSAFCEYCRLTSKEKMYSLDRSGAARETFPFTRGDYDDCNTIVWFMCVDWSGGSWKLPCDPVESETADVEDESPEFREIYDDDDEFLLSNDLDVWRQTLEAYAAASPEDWPFFYVPESSAALDGFSYRFHPFFSFNSSSNSPREGIEVWLREKPGRKVVVVLASSDSTFDYWSKIQELANERFEDPMKQNALDDCREIFAHYSDGDSNGDFHSSRRSKNGAVLRAHTMASNILDASLLLTILDSAPVLIETPQDLTNSLRRDKLDLTEEFATSYELEYGSESLADLKASIRKLVEDFNRSEYSSPADSVAGESVFRRERQRDWGEKEACYSLTGNEEDRWFVQRHLLPRDEEENRSFSGLRSWTSCLPESAPFREDFQLIPGEGTEVLLLHGDSPLVCRRAEGEGEILLVNSASFMTNFAMTEEVGRAFVRRLTQEFSDNGPIGLTFSPIDYPPIEHDYHYDPPKLDGRFSVAQRSVFTEFVWRLTLLGTVVFFCFWPIFGRPRRRIESKSSDFTLHLDAYAQLLKRVDSTRWTHEQLDKFTGKFRGEDQENLGKKKTED